MGKDTIILSLILFNFFFIAFIGGIVIFIREYRKKKRIHVKELENVDLLHKEELLKTQTEIQKETMQYIGREIHDNVGQKLTLTSLYLQQLSYENKTPEINNKIDSINNIVNESLDDLRHLSKSLTNDRVQFNSISELIKNECIKIKNLKKYNVIFDSNLKTDINSYQTKSLILRIVQEFIQNSIKHSNCSNINISLSIKDDNLLLLLKDNGIGFEIENKNYKGIGLLNMKKRIEILKGTYALKSNQKGTNLTLTIPIK